MAFCRTVATYETGITFDHMLSLHDLAEMFLERGFVFTQEAVREWEECFVPLLTVRLRAKRRGKVGRS